MLTEQEVLRAQSLNETAMAICCIKTNRQPHLKAQSTSVGPRSLPALTFLKLSGLRYLMLEMKKLASPSSPALGKDLKS